MANPNEVTPKILERVYKDNVAVHNIETGDGTDGITAEVAKDMGFQTPEDVRRLSAGLVKEEVDTREGVLPTSPVVLYRQQLGPDWYEETFADRQRQAKRRK